MRKLLYLLTALLASMAAANAQDLITKRNGEDIKAKVLEITPNEVKYRYYDEPDGAIYRDNKSDILIIRYESGRNEIFNQMPAQNKSNWEYSAVLRPNMKYRGLKTIYNYMDYTPSISDRYSPFCSGLASFFIPGLGECLGGEWGRGLSKFFGNLSLLTLGNLFLISGAESSNYEYSSPVPIFAALACYTAVLSIDIWSIVDAVRIAKVKNMYEQDLNMYALDIELYPSVNSICTPKGVQPTAGFTLAMRF